MLLDSLAVEFGQTCSYAINTYVQLFYVLAVIVGGQETSEQRILLAKRPHVIVGKLCNTIYIQLSINY